MSGRRARVVDDVTSASPVDHGSHGESQERGPAASGRLAPVEQQRAGPDLVLLLGGALVSTAGSSLTVVAVLIHLRPLGSGWVAAAFAAEIAPVVLLAALVSPPPARSSPWWQRGRASPVPGS